MKSLVLALFLIFGLGGQHAVAQSPSTPSINEPDVRKGIQTALNLLGFNAGTADGKFGRQTRQAIRRYQTSIGARATGRLSVSQVRDLISAGQKRLSEPQARQSATDARPVRNGFISLPATDLVGGDYRDPRTDKSLIGTGIPGCRAACAREDQCAAFTYNTRTRWCFLKSSTGKRSKYQYAISGIKASRAAADEPARSQPVRQTALPQTCGDPAADLVARAKRITVSTRAPERLAAANPIPVEWATQDGGFADSNGLYLVFAMTDSVRFAVTREEKPKKADGPGFVAFPGSARGPHGMRFGAGRMRAVVPLHMPGAPSRGTFAIKPYANGAFDFDWAVVAISSCGEQVLHRAKSPTFTVVTGRPQISAQDRFAINEPGRIVISPGRRYHVHVFDKYYRVLDADSGDIVFERSGSKPRFGHSDRFITAKVLDRSFGDRYEVVDLVAREVVLNGKDGPSISGELTWYEGDLFVASLYNYVSAIPSDHRIVHPYVDRLTSSEKLAFEIVGESICNACQQPDIFLDPSDLFVLFRNPEDRTGATGLIEMATHHSACCKHARSVVPYVARRISARGFDQRRARRIKWNAGDTVSHDKLYARQTTKRRAHGKNAKRRKVSQVAFRGDWRSTSRGFVRTGDAPSAKHLLRKLRARLKSLGLALTDVTARKTILYAHDDSGERALNGAALRRWEQTRKKKIARLRNSVLDHFPDLRDTLPEIGACGEGQETEICLERGTLDLDYTDRFTLIRSPSLKVGVAQLSTVVWGSRVGGRIGAILAIVKAPGQTSRIVHVDRQPTGSMEQLFFDYESQAIFDLTSDNQLIISAPTLDGITSCTLGNCDDRKRIVKAAQQTSGIVGALRTSDDSHAVQVNANGEFFIERTSDGEVVLRGYYVDDEVILWTSDGYFDATQEGAHFVRLRFPGRTGQYSFHQFEAKLRLKGLARKVLDGAALPAVEIGVPPSITAVLGAAEAGRITGSAKLRLADGANAVNIYQDGILTDRIPAVGIENVTIDVKRLPNTRWVSAIAIGESGLASQPVGRDLGANRGGKGRIHLLAVGIDRYEDDRVESLRYARADARTIHTAIRKGGGKRFDVASHALLTDTEASPVAVLAKAQEVIEAAVAGETIVFFFAGHGVKDKDGRFYLATSATNPDDMANTALPWTKLADVLKRAPTRVLVFLDACNSGAAGTGFYATNDDAAAGLLDNMPSGLVIFSASKGRELSQERPDAGGGVFTNAVADVIARKRRAHDSNRNGAIEISELYTGVKKTVTRQTSGDQTPWLARNQMIGDFALF